MSSARTCPGCGVTYMQLVGHYAPADPNLVCFKCSGYEEDGNIPYKPLKTLQWFRRSQGQKLRYSRSSGNA